MGVGSTICKYGNRGNSHFGFRRSPNGRVFPPDRIVPIVSYVGGVLGGPLTFVLGGALILGIVKGLLGVPLRFSQVFAVMAYAWLPRVIYVGLSIAVMFLKNPEDFDIQNSFASNP